MDKKQAIIILIQDSQFEDDIKQRMIGDVENMDSETLNELGKALAIQKKEELMAIDKAVKSIDEFLEEAEK